MNELEEKLTKQITPRQLTLSDLGINYKKPTKEEYLTVVKISGLGILLIGLLGFAVQMIELMFFK